MPTPAELERTVQRLLANATGLLEIARTAPEAVCIKNIHDAMQYIDQAKIVIKRFTESIQPGRAKLS